jgi:hypothetical protein
VNWAQFILIVAKEGLPLAESLFTKWSTSKDQPVTQEEINELKALGSKTARSQMLDALARAGISPESPEGKALLQLTP